MKACKLILPILLAFLLLTGCSGESTSVSPASLSDIQNGNAVWSEECRRIYYSDGRKIFSCNEAGEDAAFVCKLPGRLKKDFAEIAAATADNLIIKCGKRSCNYYSLNIQTGETFLLFDNIPYHSLPQILCSNGNTLLSVQKPREVDYNPVLVNTVLGEETIYVLSTNINTAESEVLGNTSADGSVSNADGAILSDRLFFICGPSRGMYSVSLTGGEIEFIQPNTEEIPEMDIVVSLEEKDGMLYMLMWSESTYPKCALCLYDPHTNKVLPIVTTDNTFTAKNFLINGNTYYLFDEFSSVSGKLQSSY